ncbi:DsbA family protein [Helicobacter heilmannii]|uniref:PROTEIN DISULPHIDE ISOMERASE n=1 Tax=Helicobacter heilmannii TaxID=35817 RepID=A0A0K2XP14_HELHE|nr:disulphide isomerase [Helicobacter heilmannii]CCM11818.1 disulphide isomerase [Helicobacter heilmannii ASB1.4]CRF48298.1 disulphide isomerase [Helicobacter heilmannii]CRF50116.1 disulphide isomerase [Helicobacter heilmannii]CRF51443.1 disulphide isomerase [Helicobacter heilmannii]CRI33957.1 PROTEIN DISULPHIDE ISOMERASE [Helicobacter heilmannii]
MRRLFCALSLCVGFVGAVESKAGQAVADLIDKQIHKKVNVLEVKSLKSNKDFQVVVVEDPDTKYKIPLLVNKNGDLVIGLTNIFFSKSKQDTEFIQELYHNTQSYNFAQQNSAALNALFEGLPKGYAIDLKSTTPGVKKNLYIISDPMCPHCHHELEQIDKRLKEANVHMVLVGFLGHEAMLKAADILKQVKKARNTKEKVSLLQKVYAYNYKPSDVPDDKVQEVEKVTKTIEDTKLVKGVPFIYDYHKAAGK